MDALARACEDYFYDFDPWMDVPLAAAESLSAGLMSQALIDLACLRRDDRSEICALVPQVFAELGRAFPSGPAAAFARAKEVAQECLGGRLSLEEGVARLTRFLMKEPSCGDTYCHDYGDILVFQETHHALHCQRCQAAGTIPYYFPDNDAAIAAFLEFLQELADSDHDCRNTGAVGSRVREDWA
ncbi:hypothetical protein [Glycomyces harbinensis]|nr:hypothetical protein [Glycomyces harbinensis]